MSDTDQTSYSKKRKYISICLIVFALALILIGVTIAYFTSSDEVANAFEGHDVKIALYEPNWYDSGEEDADLSEPGMVIAKDPYVTNKSTETVYVRMKLTLTDASGDEISSKSNSTDPDGQYEKIMAALLYSYAKNTNGTLDTSSAKTIRLFNTDTSGTLLLNNANMNNPYFYYYTTDGWFYYIGPVDSSDGTVSGSEDEPTALAKLEKGDSTQHLFQGFDIPVDDDEYYGYFDSEFHIDITAQAISTYAVSVEAGESGYFAAVVAAFEEEYPD